MHRISSLHSLIIKNDELFFHVQDYFFITELQSRGTNHDHEFLHIQDAPIYQNSPNADVMDFIDHYLTSNSTILSNQMIQFQTHHHTKT